MKKPMLWLWVTFGCVGIAGCEHLPRRSEQPAAHTATPANEGETDSTPGFFKSTRLPGAMSEEGADIERSLGVQPH
jgi:hypothetical protein